MGAGRRVCWAVHGYTALGLVLAGLAAVFIVEGGDRGLRAALLLLLLAAVVDATDGWLARRFQVSEALPSVDGRRLDDLVDFHTHVSLPLFLLWRMELFSEGLAWILLLPLLASAYGFSRVDAKTADGYFVGFPSYWNVVAFYFFVLAPPAWLAGTLLLALTALVFVPTRYLYPSSHGGGLERWTTLLGWLWSVLVLVILLEVPERVELWALLSLAFPAFYIAASFWVSRDGRGDSREGGVKLPS